MDHFISRSKGGRGREKNLIPACQRCNNRKDNSRPFAWYYRQAFFSYSNQQWTRLLSALGYPERIKALLHDANTKRIVVSTAIVDPSVSQFGRRGGRDSVDQTDSNAA